MHWRSTHEKSKIVDAAGFEGDGASMHVLNPRDPAKRAKIPSQRQRNPRIAPNDAKDALVRTNEVQDM